MDMKTTSEYMALLRKYMVENAHKYGIMRMGIFGSVARQENREDSDLDIVVDIDNPTLSTMYTLKTVLTEMFHCEIDLVRFRSSLSPFLKQNIEKEAIYV